ncbi:hypothetical protein [Sulfuricurvum sp.]|uniref:hypothetical protein n=1 Tax=Sulfuricurvum sp. TaxID=2025608 RepID=UPI003C40DBF5
MVTFISLLIIVAIAYWIRVIISRKQGELADKEHRQREQFLKESQSLLKSETSAIPSPAISDKTYPSTNEYYRIDVTRHWNTQGYTITESVKAEGIDLIGFKEKELLLVRCETALREVKKIDLQVFIADCTTYIDKNPMLQGRSCVRFYATNRPLNEEAVMYVRENPASIHLMEEF